MPPKPKAEPKEEVTRPAHVAPLGKPKACPVCGNLMAESVCVVDGYREGAPQS